EQKTRLYEQIQRGEVDSATIDPKGGSILVDFDRKGWDEETREYVGIPDCLHPSDPFTFLANLYGVVEAGGELVEFVDEFGRTRWVNLREKARLEAEREETEQLLRQASSNNHDSFD